MCVPTLFEIAVPSWNCESVGEMWGWGTFINPRKIS